MGLKVRVKPGSSQEKIKWGGDSYDIWLKEKPIEGKANIKLLKLLKKYFKKDVKIKSGFKSRNKIVELN